MVPLVEAEYQKNCGADAALVELTEAVGIPSPHCVELVAVGAEGDGKTVSVNVEEFKVQPLETMAVEYVVVVVGETEILAVVAPVFHKILVAATDNCAPKVKRGRCE
jgi:hypothetical protein